jgi:hypothetical protein
MYYAEDSQMKSVPSFLALAASFFMLAGCSGEDSKNASVDRSTLPEATISEFSIEGTSPAQADLIPINANVEEGRFKIRWNIAPESTFHLTLFLSQDEVVSADDIHVFDNAVCGAVRLNDCLAEDSYDCQFGTDNTLSCTDGWETYNDDLAANGFLSALPQVAYIIGEACVGSDCKHSVVKVEFQ